MVIARAKVGLISEFENRGENVVIKKTGLKE